MLFISQANFPLSGGTGNLHREDDLGLSFKSANNKIKNFQLKQKEKAETKQTDHRHIQ